MQIWERRFLLLQGLTEPAGEKHSPWKNMQHWQMPGMI